ncbi:MAG: class I SAM-dependent methyltransferase [Spirochaetaceae bacterium]|jgi:23S rRNA G2069 N7-methylase RlmK/C1962 C5-methylase RlmI|nr:class I SAM-dependent methyltransferase [Spirochaetaceae bacterium]
MIKNETESRAELHAEVSHTESQAGLHTESQAESQAIMLFNRLRKRQKHLRKWAARTGAGVYRLYDRDIPEIPLVLDFYHNEKTAAVSGALYKRPYEKNADDETRWLCVMKTAVAKALSIKEENIFLKIRKRQRVGKSNEQYTKEDGGAFTMLVKENGVSFSVNLSSYIDSGIFPDLRKLRKMLMSEAPGKTVLNLFCYTGAFSVYAAKGGARRIDSVDMSSTYLKWTARNFQLNGAEIPPSCAHTEIQSDVFRFIEQAAASNKQWDIIVVDPPAFSNSKRMKGNSLNGVFDIKHDYQFLITSCLPLLKKGGSLFFCVNARSFNLQTSDLCNSIKERGGFSLRRITEQIRDEDFKGRRMPECYIITE